MARVRSDDAGTGGHSAARPFCEFVAASTACSTVPGVGDAVSLKILERSVSMT